MASAILAVLLVLAACACFGFAVISAGANRFGGATAPDQVNHKPTYLALLFGVICIILAIVFGVGA